ncbi:hypothetical protein BDF22DRAFT_694278 [Syncephalis plumigaleata]|nr:hypothetical protein BDF22DRAFT_694278 [Syncephalis plumigaleata]
MSDQSLGPASSTIKKSSRIRRHVAKRAPQRPATKANDIYVTRKSSFHGQLARAKKLLASNEPRFETIIVHGLGAAIPRAIELATAIETSMRHQYFRYDIYPKDQEIMPSTQERFNSAIHIAIRRKLTLASSTVQPLPKGHGA